MFTSSVHLRSALVVSLSFLTVALLASCSFDPGSVPGGLCNAFEAIPLTPLSSQTSQMKFEVPGTIIAIHGSGRAATVSGDVIRVEQSLPVPAYANQAAVFLNGWSVGYSGADEHVLALGSAITKIRRRVDPVTRSTTLVWNALGLLRDESGSKGYEWVYDFTVLAWNDANVRAVVDQGVVSPNDSVCADGTDDIADNYYISNNSGANTALSYYKSFIQNTVFRTGESIGALPRGFGLAWGDYFRGFFYSSDHHVLQVAYNLDHGDAFVSDKKEYNIRRDEKKAATPPGASKVGEGFFSWGSYAILKDNDTRRGYLFGEVVSAMGGRDVGFVQPPFSILPAQDGPTLSFFCSDGAQASSTPVTENFVVQNVPFEFALPMLTGWDLQFLTCDQHVKEVGIRITDWNYQPPAGGVGGTLRYTLSSVLRDEDNWPDFSHSHKITILGLRPVSGDRGPAGGPGPQ